EVGAEEEFGRPPIVACTVARTPPQDGCMNQRVSAVNQRPPGTSVAQFARKPFDDIGNLLKAAAVAARSMPTYQPMAGAGEPLHYVTSQEAGRPGNRNSHESSLLIGPSPNG